MTSAENHGARSHRALSALRHVWKAVLLSSAVALLVSSSIVPL
jgi:hypothetical protein